MSKGYFVWHESVKIKNRHDLIDPRMAIVRHIGWDRTTSDDTPWTTPEPNNYNRAIMVARPAIPPMVKNCICYQQEDKFWWMVSLVTADIKSLYDAWEFTQPYHVRWFHPNAPGIKPQRKLLYGQNKNCDITANERLFAMGYYANLSSKYFGDDDTMLLSRLGPVRDRIFEDLSESS